MVRIYPKRPELFLNKGTRYLVDTKILEYIKAIVSPSTHVVQIGAGTGNISSYLPSTSILIEPDLRHSDALSRYSTVLWKSIFQTTLGEIDSCDTLVSNLPYDKSVAILLHCVKTYPKIDRYFVILQEQVTLSIISGGGSLYHKFNHLFEIKLHKIIPKTAFSPTPTVNGALMELTPRSHIDWRFIIFLNTLFYPRKTLHNNGLNGCFRRINEVSTIELYDLFKRHNSY